MIDDVFDKIEELEKGLYTTLYPGTNRFLKVNEDKFWRYESTFIEVAQRILNALAVVRAEDEKVDMQHIPEELHAALGEGFDYPYSYLAQIVPPPDLTGIHEYHALSIKHMTDALLRSPDVAAKLMTRYLALVHVREHNVEDTQSFTRLAERFAETFFHFFRINERYHYVY